METLLHELDGILEELLKQWNVAGMSVALVKDGRLLDARGYGKRDLEKGLPMTGSTMMPIGSITKSFTALALGMLADEGKLDWDKPVRTYIPWLKLMDPVTAERVTVRDLLCHRTGIPRYDLQVAFCALEDRKAQIETFQYLQPSADFRTVLQYSNQMVTIAGYLVEVLSGQSWESFVKERIFDKLGMERTDFEMASLAKYDDTSKGYVFTGTGQAESGYMHLGALAPAGGIVSCASDMARYALFQLGDGTWEGTRLISKENLNMMHTHQMIGSPYFWSFEELQSADYGLCWFTDIYRGKKMVSHGGNTNGFSSQLTLLPESGFGLVALSNATSSFSVNVLSNLLSDKVLGVREIPDWNARYQEIFTGMMNGALEGMKQRAEARIPDTSPSHPLSEYCGSFSNPGFGSFSIEEKDGALTGKWNGFDALFTHYHYDCYDMTLPFMNAVLPVRFESGADGHIHSLSVPVEPTPGIDPVVFIKN